LGKGKSDIAQGDSSILLRPQAKRAAWTTLSDGPCPCAIRGYGSCHPPRRMAVPWALLGCSLPRLGRTRARRMRVCLRPRSCFSFSNIAAAAVLLYALRGVNRVLDASVVLERPQGFPGVSHPRCSNDSPPVMPHSVTIRCAQPRAGHASARLSVTWVWRATTRLGAAIGNQCFPSAIFSAHMGSCNAIDPTITAEGHAPQRMGLKAGFEAGAVTRIVKGALS